MAWHGIAWHHEQADEPETTHLCGRHLLRVSGVGDGPVGVVGQADVPQHPVGDVFHHKPIDAERALPLVALVRQSSTMTRSSFRQLQQILHEQLLTLRAMRLLDPAASCLELVILCGIIMFSALFSCAGLTHLRPVLEVRVEVDGAGHLGHATEVRRAVDGEEEVDGAPALPGPAAAAAACGTQGTSETQRAATWPCQGGTVVHAINATIVIGKWLPEVISRVL